MFVLTNQNNPNALKLIIGAKIAKNAVDIKIVPANESIAGRLPTLNLSNGITLVSSNAALQYLVSDEKSVELSVNTWLEWEVTQLQPAIVSYGNSGYLDTSHKPRIWSLLSHLNGELKDKKYLINNNDELTSADIAIWSIIWCTISITDTNKEIAKEFPNVDRWIKDVEKLSIIQEALRDFQIQRGYKAITSIQSASWFPINSYTGGKLCRFTSENESQGSPNKEAKESEVVTKQEMDVSKKNWSTPSNPSIEKLSYPVLPNKGERNILITSALPYVNNVPHLGNIIGCVLSADVFARYCRQRHYNTLYISGTDEYGTATEAKALEEKMTPQEICDKFFDIHNDIYRWFNIGFDYFGRTTTPEQTEIVQDMFLRIQSQGYIITESVDQLLCETCNRFLADRFVEGTCPGCKYEDARGDQCDGCGHLVNATELIKPRCKVCSKTPVIKESTQFFLDLPQIQPKVKEWASAAEAGWSNVARVVTRPWLRDGLKPRCITRDLKWGIPVPLNGFRDKVFYVWFDAPLGYVSITKRYTSDYEKWWKPEKDTDVHLYQFMAKDNVPFHAIMFPATLLAADQGHILVKHIMATEYLNYEDTKFSKSRGIGVFGTDARETGIPAEIWRFYLTYIRPESQDSNFNWQDLATKNNSELLNNFGNFVNRALTFAAKNFNGVLPEMNPREEDFNVLVLVQRELTQYIAAMEQAKLRDGLRHVLAISKHGNQYMQSQQPWVMIRGNEESKKSAATVIGICCNLSCLLSALLGPFMPNTSRQLRKQLGLDATTYGYIPETVSILLLPGHKLGNVSPLFTKIEDSQVEELRTKYAGKQENGNGSTPPLSSNKAVTDLDIPALEAEIVKQGKLVRELKAKAEKTVWQPQVQVLLQLKKKLADLTESSNTTVNTSTIAMKRKESVPIQNGESSKNSHDLPYQKDGCQPDTNILLNLKKDFADHGFTIKSNPGNKNSKEKK